MNTTDTGWEKTLDAIEDWNAECELFDDTPLSDYMEKKRRKEYRDGLLSLIQTMAKEEYERGRKDAVEFLKERCGWTARDFKGREMLDVPVDILEAARANTTDA